jgi:SAM-dependent methyltransferase
VSRYGYFTKLLGQVSGDLVAIDPSTQAVNIAKEYLAEEQNISIERISIEDFEPNSRTLFDLAVSNMTFQVISDLPMAIKKISAIIRNQGRLIFSIPHPCYWPIYKGLDSSQSFFYHQTSSHSVPFTISNDGSPLPTKIPYHHRPIEYYSKLLSSSGFLISEILEPFPDKALMKLYDKSWDYPHFLIISATIFKNS